MSEQLQSATFIERDGGYYLRVQASRAPVLIGISRTTFYKDQLHYGWEEEKGLKGTTHYYVPKHYVERRRREREERERNAQLYNEQLEHAAQYELTQPESVSNSQLELTLTMVEATFSKLIEEKDRMIAQLELRLEREKELNAAILEAKEQTILAKEDEVSTLKGLMMLTANKENPQSIQYAPVKPGFLSWFNPFKK